MIFLLETWGIIRGFLEAGGQVLLLVFGATFVLWTMILERFWYYWTVHKGEVKKAIENWTRREDKSSWTAHRIRESIISDVSGRFEHGIGFVKTLVAVCPLFGLLGTVTGMINVFEVMAMTGTNNARLMASGISMATIPTMAGMVAALSGLYFGNKLEQTARLEREKLADHLPFH
jgi:biopolymer transport protein ExbB